jgi:hypothetical protein
MRFVYRVGCAVALVACADSQNPTVPVSSRPLRPTDTPLAPGSTNTQFDPRSVPDRIEELVGQRLAKVSIPPDGFSLSSDAVHPDIACPPNVWSGARCWLMYTPYKNSDSGYENPALLSASNDTTWSTPAEIKNPIVPYPGFQKYNSDPDHAFDPVTGRMVQIYRVVADTFNKIMIMSTADAKQWTPATIAFKERNHDAVSPSLIIESNRQAKIWYVRTGTDGCSSASSSVQLRVAMPDSDSRYERSEWSAPTAVNLALPGYVVWHLDITSLPNNGGYMALVVGYAKGLTCGASELWLATSSDGIAWRSYPMPIMWRTMKLAKKRAISTWYRGTLRYDAATDSLHIWPSALSGTNWTVYHTAVKLSDILGLLQVAQPADLRNALMSLKPATSTMRMP